MRLLLLAVCVTVSLASPKTPWDVYKLTYTKLYETPQEEHIRAKLFQKTLDFIEQHNLEYDMGLHTYTVGINAFSDWTDEEYQQLLGTHITSEPHKEEKRVKGPRTAAIDWRKLGAINPVKDQGQCGSCWAFAAVCPMEAFCFLKRKHLFTLSEQQLVDCSRHFGNNGCGGGWHHYAFQYVQSTGGIVTEKDYPYTARDDPCSFESKRDHIVCRCDGYISARGEGGLEGALAEDGPVGVALDASRPGFRNYRAGIYDDKLCNENHLNHAVTAVGFTEQAWIVRNSWNERWGDKGYILMKKWMNICGIGNAAHFPIMSDRL